MNTNGNYYENRLRKRESFKRLINIGLSMICLLLEISLFAYMWQFHFQFQLVDFLPGVCNPDGGCADLCGTVYDGP